MATLVMAVVRGVRCVEFLFLGGHLRARSKLRESVSLARTASCLAFLFPFLDTTVWPVCLSGKCLCVCVSVCLYVCLSVLPGIARR